MTVLSSPYFCTLLGSALLHTVLFFSFEAGNFRVPESTTASAIGQFPLALVSGSEGRTDGGSPTPSVPEASTRETHPPAAEEKRTSLTPQKIEEPPQKRQPTRERRRALIRHNASVPAQPEERPQPNGAETAAPPLSSSSLQAPVSEVSNSGGSGEEIASGSSTIVATPDYLRNPAPYYPMAARKAHEEGVVMLIVRVDANGDVEDLSLKKSSGFPRLDTAAEQAVRAWKFHPARTAGMAVASIVEVPVRFVLR